MDHYPPLGREAYSRGRWREDPSKPKSAEPATAPSGALPASAAAAAPSGDAAPARASVLPAAVAARLHPRSCPRSVLACAETTVETTNDRSSSDRVLTPNEETRSEETRLEVAHGACRCDTVRDAYHWSLMGERLAPRLVGIWRCFLSRADASIIARSVAGGLPLPRAVFRGVGARARRRERGIVGRRPRRSTKARPLEVEESRLMLPPLGSPG